MKLETWNEADMRGLIKELYEKKGYQVRNTHGRLEPGIDLLAKKFDSAEKNVIEQLGIQVTIPKADKSRVKDAAFALNQRDLHLSYFVVIAIGGRTEDFDLQLQQCEFKDKVIFIDGGVLEKELFTQGIIPDQELQRLESEFYKSNAYAVLQDITKTIYERGYLAKLELDSALKSILENTKMITENLRLFMRGLQEISSSAGSVYLSMLSANSKCRTEEFIDQFVKGQSLILKPLEKARSAIGNLDCVPAVMKLFFGALSGTERGSLIQREGDVTNDFWIFTYFEPELIYTHGYRVVLLQIFCGLQDRPNAIKNRVERVLSILEGGVERIRKDLESSISNFPIQAST